MKPTHAPHCESCRSPMMTEPVTFEHVGKSLECVRCGAKYMLIQKGSWKSKEIPTVEAKRVK